MQRIRNLIWAYRIQKVKVYIQRWRVEHSKQLTVEEWSDNNTTCLYLHKFENKLIKWKAQTTNHYLQTDGRYK